MSSRATPARARLIADQRHRRGTSPGFTPLDVARLHPPREEASTRQGLRANILIRRTESGGGLASIPDLDIAPRFTNYRRA